MIEPEDLIFPDTLHIHPSSRSANRERSITLL